MAAIATLIALLAVPAIAANVGKWSSTIKFPLVPVAAAVHPQSGQLLVWSAYRNDSFSAGAEGVTQTAVYNPADGSVQEFPVAYTGHDMFCPGISFDFNGQLVVTGGDTASKTSVFHSDIWTWKAAAEMVVARGYQSSATLSDGRIFTIGGSWSGGLGGKDGEVYDGNSNTWTSTPGCAVAPMLTNDAGGIFRQDNHAWLFGWKNGSVFQAGPSKAMNWYYPSGSGSYKAAGTRGSNDAMCGPVAMYDATQGKILAVGGSPSYEQAFASSAAYIITIGNPGNAAQVETITSMAYTRMFATSTVLPDGQVLVLGGQSWGHPFSDANSTLVPELWNPSTKKFTKLATGPTPRNYHSVSVLMPNATVFNGGGGLCGDCGSNNHFDGQLFSPPYLFQSDGVTPAARPQITTVSTSKSKIGTQIVATIKPTTGTVAFSLVRIGSSTHTVNTDQRRVPLKISSSSGNSYTLQLPSDAGIATPGYWYLFALQGGVPSIAQTVLLAP